MDIKASHKPITNYYKALEDFAHHGLTKETTVRAAFAEVLQTYARKKKWSFVEEYGLPLRTGTKGSVDGALLDAFSVPMGFWEAKDEADDLKKEVKKKFEIGYPKSNILFQKPTTAALYQDGQLIDDYDLTKPERLVACLNDFFEYHSEEVAEWTDVVDQFKERIPESANKLIQMIEVEKKENRKFQEAFQTFAELCRASINPNLADAAIEEMLVQHMLTPRIFGTVFNNPDFVRRNVIASEIEKVIDALTARVFDRHQFFAPLDHFYVTLENRAKSITDWSQKQSFLNTVYEKFFQGFAVKVADTHGIVYTPQPIVDFMVKSVQHILRTEFNRSLADEGVHILDPFVGTGNFIMRIMREIAETAKSKLPQKYATELHCNEVMLLPYYIASMNIEHEFYTQTGRYQPFDGICLVDTFELAEPAQTTLFSTENSERVERQKKSPIFVIIGNPPYNAGQVNENDNNKNRKYPVVDKRVASEYAQGGKAGNKNALADPYVKAFRYASDKVIANGEGVIAFVTNNSFLTDLAFDAMRQRMASEFDEIYVVDLTGNVRKNPKLSGTTHNVFGIQVGVSINILVRKRGSVSARIAKISYARTGEDWKRSEKHKFLHKGQDVQGVAWSELEPDEQNNWLTEGIDNDFQSLVPLGQKGVEGRNAPECIFAMLSNGVKTNRDSWAYNFDGAELERSIKRSIDAYSEHLARFRKLPPGAKLSIDDFVDNEDERISWSETLKSQLLRRKPIDFEQAKIRASLYRPFTREYLYFDASLNERRYQVPKMFPESGIGHESFVISSTCHSQIPFSTVALNKIPCIDFGGRPTQFFSFYTYDEDGNNRRENITDWALAQFREKVSGSASGVREPVSVGSGEGKKSRQKANQAADEPRTQPDTGSRTPDTEGSPDTERTLTKWDIFYYVYGLLHHPTYRTKYAANLRRELPRIPIVKDAATFWKFSNAGKQLAEIHVNYEKQKEYNLEEKWVDDAPLDLKVEKMKLTKDKTGIVYNEWLTLRGIPEEAFNYKLGNRSAIDWIIDQYQVSTDKRSGITNDPNRQDDEHYIIRLIKQIVTVSLETVRIVGEIGKLSLD